MIRIGFRGGKEQKGVYKKYMSKCLLLVLAFVYLLTSIIIPLEGVYATNYKTVQTVNDKSPDLVQNLNISMDSINNQIDTHKIADEIHQASGEPTSVVEYVYQVDSTLQGSPIFIASADLEVCFFGDTATITWNAVTGAIRYEIYRNGELIGTSATTSFTDAGLSPELGYKYAVKAYFEPESVITESDDFTVLSMPATTISTDCVLVTDAVYGDLNLTGGTLDLNGHILTINGNLKQYDGILKINNGTLNVTGDYIIQSSSGIYCPGILQMTEVADKITVGGNFYTDSMIDHSQYLTSGVLDVKGNFTQKTSYYSDGSLRNFNATNTHRVLLSGANTQTITIEDYKYSGFNFLEVTNINGISCSTPISICNLKSDLIVQGNLIIVNNMDVGGNTVTVSGNLIQSGGTLKINNGVVNVTGDYKISDDYGNSNPRVLQMTEPADRVVVGGNFLMDSTVNHSQYLTSGVLEVKGNFTQRTSYYIDAGCLKNFSPTGTHKVLMSGTNLQTIYFEDYNYSGFNDLEVTNTSQGINCSTPISIYHLQKDLMITGDLVIGGNTDLGGNTLTINGNLTQTGGILKINNGMLKVTGDYKIQGIYGGFGPGILQMTGAADRVVVGRNFSTDSEKDHSQYLTSGVLEVKGNFTQKSGYPGIVPRNNFNASGTHKVLLSGSNIQVISFEDPGISGFCDLEVTNTTQGVSYSTPISIHNLKNDLTIQGNIEIAGNTDIGGNTLAVNGNLIQSGGTLKINGGKLYVTGDYKIQQGSGPYDPRVLQMIEVDDKVVVGGNFVMDSTVDHSQYLTSGVLEVKGDFTQKTSYYSEGCLKNFCPTGANKVLLSGPNSQAVNFEDYNYSRFNTLIITKPLDTGYTFNYQPLWVTLMEMADDNEAPSTPDSLAVTSKTSSSVSLSWTGSTDSTIVDKYSVLRNGEIIGETPDTSFVDTGLLPNTTYTYSVKAYDRNNNSSNQSNTVTVITNEKPDWYYVRTTDIDGNLLEVYLSDIGAGAGESNETISAIAKGSSDILWKEYVLSGDIWNDTGVTYASPPGGGVITAAQGLKENNIDEASVSTMELPMIFNIDLEAKKDEILNKIYDKLGISPSELTAENIKMLALGVAYSIDDNVTFGIVQWLHDNTTGIEPPEDKYYYMRAKAYTDAMFVAAYTTATLGSAAAALSSLEASGLSSSMALATSPSGVGAVAFGTAAITELAGAAVMSGVSYISATLAERSQNIFRASIEKLQIIIDKAREYAIQGTKNPLSNEVVLGRFTQDSTSYVNVAKERGATYFQLDNWDEVASTFGDDKMWLINEQFLNQQWSAGKEFLFSHNPWEAASGSFFESEVLHLMDLGVKDFIQFAENLWKAIK